jgi:hypothetical protein
VPLSSRTFFTQGVTLMLPARTFLRIWRADALQLCDAALGGLPLRLGLVPLLLQGRHQGVVLDGGDPLHQALLGDGQVGQLGQEVRALGRALGLGLDVGRLLLHVLDERLGREGLPQRLDHRAVEQVSGHARGVRAAGVAALAVLPADVDQLQVPTAPGCDE